MTASTIIKWIISSTFLKMNEDNMDVDEVLAAFRDDAVWDVTSELGIGETIKGKKAIADWFRRWKEEFPKRKFDVKNVKNVCFSAWPLNLTNVFNIQWSLTQTDKQGKKFKHDGVTVMHVRNFKISHAVEA